MLVSCSASTHFRRYPGAVVDMDAAIGFVVAKGDPVERARLSWLRTGAVPTPDVLAKAELGQAGPDVAPAAGEHAGARGGANGSDAEED